MAEIQPKKYKPPVVPKGPMAPTVPTATAQPTGPAYTPRYSYLHENHAIAPNAGPMNLAPIAAPGLPGGPRASGMPTPGPSIPTTPQPSYASVPPPPGGVHGGPMASFRGSAAPLASQAPVQAEVAGPTSVTPGLPGGPRASGMPAPGPTVGPSPYDPHFSYAPERPVEGPRGPLNAATRTATPAGPRTTGMPAPGPTPGPTPYDPHFSYLHENHAIPPNRGPAHAVSGNRTATMLPKQPAYPARPPYPPVPPASPRVRPPTGPFTLPGARRPPTSPVRSATMLSTPTAAPARTPYPPVPPAAPRGRPATGSFTLPGPIHPPTIPTPAPLPTAPSLSGGVPPMGGSPGFAPVGPSPTAAPGLGGGVAGMGSSAPSRAQAIYRGTSQFGGGPGQQGTIGPALPPPTGGEAYEALTRKPAPARSVPPRANPNQIYSDALQTRVPPTVPTVPPPSASEAYAALTGQAPPRANPNQVFDDALHTPVGRTPPPQAPPQSGSFAGRGPDPRIAGTNTPRGGTGFEGMKAGGTNPTATDYARRAAGAGANAAKATVGTIPKAGAAVNRGVGNMITKTPAMLRSVGPFAALQAASDPEGFANMVRHPINAMGNMIEGVANGVEGLGDGRARAGLNRLASGDGSAWNYASHNFPGVGQVLGAGENLGKTALTWAQGNGPAAFSAGLSKLGNIMGGGSTPSPTVATPGQAPVVPATAGPEPVPNAADLNDQYAKAGIGGQEKPWPSTENLPPSPVQAAPTPAVPRDRVRESMMRAHDYLVQSGAVGQGESMADLNRQYHANVLASGKGISDYDSARAQDTEARGRGALAQEQARPEAERLHEIGTDPVAQANFLAAQRVDPQAMPGIMNRTAATVASQQAGGNPTIDASNWRQQLAGNPYFANFQKYLLPDAKTGQPMPVDQILDYAQNFPGGEDNPNVRAMVAHGVRDLYPGTDLEDARYSMTPGLISRLLSSDNSANQKRLQYGARLGLWGSQ